MLCISKHLRPRILFCGTPQINTPYAASAMQKVEFKEKRLNFRHFPILFSTVCE
jgi:hypothetical protein